MILTVATTPDTSISHRKCVFLSTIKLLKKKKTMYNLGTGRAEPIPIEVKTGRTGVGHETEKIRKRASQVAMSASRMKYNKIMEKHHNQQYREQLRSKHQQQEIERDLFNSQRVCEQLDVEQVR